MIGAFASRLAAAVLVLCVAGCGEPGTLPLTGTLRMAVTTTLRDAGLLERLLPAFRRETGIDVRPSVGSAAECLAAGERGDADVVVVDDAPAAQRFVDRGKGVLQAEVFRRVDGARRVPCVAVLVRPVAADHQRHEPARLLYDWLLGPRPAALLRSSPFE